MARLSAESTAIVLDSTSDLPEGHGRESWRVVPLYVRFGDGEAKREYVDISTAEFYSHLRGSAEPPKSAQPSPADFAAVFEDLSAYERILCVALSAKLSGTFASAELAAQDFGGKVRVLDSKVTSGGTVILADAIQRRLDRGTMRSSSGSTGSGGSSSPSTRSSTSCAAGGSARLPASPASSSP